MDDLEAFKFEKKPLDGSRACLVPSVGEDGKGGSEVKSGEFGRASAEEDCGGFGSNLRAWTGTASRGDGELLPASVGDVMSLLIADALLGTVKESDAGLAISVPL